MALEIDFDDSAVNDSYTRLCDEFPSFEASYENIIHETFIRRKDKKGSPLMPGSPYRRIPIYDVDSYDPLKPEATRAPSPIAVAVLYIEEDRTIPRRTIRVIQLWRYDQWNMDRALALIES